MLGCGLGDLGGRGRQIRLRRKILPGACAGYPGAYRDNSPRQLGRHSQALLGENPGCGGRVGSGGVGETLSASRGGACRLERRYPAADGTPCSARITMPKKSFWRKPNSRVAQSKKGYPFLVLVASGF